MSEAETTEETTALIPQLHGGALRSRGKKGNAGGGRPKDEVREKLTKLANGKGIRFLNKLLDGKIEVRLVGRCERCGELGEPDADWVEGIIDALRASVDQRLKGLDQALRFGVGTKDEVNVQTHPEVQRFVAIHAQATREVVGEESYQLIAQRVQELAA